MDGGSNQLGQRGGGRGTWLKSTLKLFYGAPERINASLPDVCVTSMAICNHDGCGGCVQTEMAYRLNHNFGSQLRW